MGNNDAFTPFALQAVETCDSSAFVLDIGSELTESWSNSVSKLLFLVLDQSIESRSNGRDTVRGLVQGDGPGPQEGPADCGDPCGVY